MNGRRLGRALAMLSLCLCAAPAAAQYEGPRQPASLIVGRWVGHRLVGYPPCPEEALCVGATVLARIADAETLTGARVPHGLSVQLHLLSGPPPPGRVSILAVWPGDEPRSWHGAIATSAEPGTDACVRTHWFDQLRVPPPRHSYVRGEMTCFTT